MILNMERGDPDSALVMNVRTYLNHASTPGQLKAREDQGSVGSWFTHNMHDPLPALGISGPCSPSPPKRAVCRPRPTQAPAPAPPARQIPLRLPLLRLLHRLRERVGEPFVASIELADPLRRNL